MTFKRALPWLLRAAWAALPFVAGPGLADALHPWSDSVRTVASVGLWAGWAVVLVATLVPHPIALTAFRIGAPAGFVASAMAALDGARAPAAVLWWVVVLGVAFLPETAMTFVNGPAYPNERRYPLRVAGPLLLGPLELAWAVVVGGPVATALLLADGQWVAGGAVGVVGVPVAVVLARALHGLSRRWVVFVPAGLVLHDSSALVDPVLFQKPVVESLAPAPAGSDSLDLTLGALGLALELQLREKVPMVLSRPGNRLGESGASARLLFTPTRPGAVLAEATKRGLPTR